jgi:hypothetical protein
MLISVSRIVIYLSMKKIVGNCEAKKIVEAHSGIYKEDIIKRLN